MNFNASLYCKLLSGSEFGQSQAALEKSRVKTQSDGPIAW